MGEAVSGATGEWACRGVGVPGSGGAGEWGCRGVLGFAMARYAWPIRSLSFGEAFNEVLGSFFSKV